MRRGKEKRRMKIRDTPATLWPKNRKSQILAQHTCTKSALFLHEKRETCPSGPDWKRSPLHYLSASEAERLASARRWSSLREGRGGISFLHKKRKIVVFLVQCGTKRRNPDGGR